MKSPGIPGRFIRDADIFTGNAAGSVL